MPPPPRTERKRKRQVTFAICDPAEGSGPAVDYTAEDVPRHSLLSDPASSPGITAFNIAEELEDGVLDLSGQQEATVDTTSGGLDPDVDSSDDDNNNDTTRLERPSSPDDWVEQLSRDSISAPAYADVVQQTRSGKRRRVTSTGEDPGVAMTSLPPVCDIVPELVYLMKYGETGSCVLRRLKAEGDADSMDTVIELCHALLEHGRSNVYDMRREQILAAVEWLLCWGSRPQCERSSGHAPTSVHGPFKASEMLTWAAARYFVQPNKRAWVNAVGSKGEWWAASSIFLHADGPG